MEQNNKSLKECGLCSENATCLCFQCMNYFCERCYKFVHNLQKNLNHKKETIDPFVPFEFKCSEHPTNPYNLFCSDEKVKSL